MIDLFSILLGAITGFLTKLIYDELKIPKLKIGDVVGPILVIHEPEYEASVISGEKKPEISSKFYHAYRIRVYNEQKFLFNTAAKNCIAWLELDVSKEPYQLCWVRGIDSLDINVGDFREVEICARNVETGVIIAPTEEGYFHPRSRIIGDGKNRLRGYLRITCQNGKRAQKRIDIVPINKDRLEIKLSN